MHRGRNAGEVVGAGVWAERGGAGVRDADGEGARVLVREAAGGARVRVGDKVAAEDGDAGVAGLRPKGGLERLHLPHGHEAHGAAEPVLAVDGGVALAHGQAVLQGRGRAVLRGGVCGQGDRRHVEPAVERHLYMWIYVDMDMDIDVDVDVDIDIDIDTDTHLCLIAEKASE